MDKEATEIKKIIDGAKNWEGGDILEYLMSLYENGELTDIIIFEMISNDIWLDYLSHMPLKNELLLKLYKKDPHMCVEAAYTIIDFALSQSCTNEEFHKIFLNCCQLSVCNYFLDTILLVKDFNSILYEKYFDGISVIKSTYDEKSDIYLKAIRHENYLKLLSEKSKKKIIEYYQECDPIYFLALSKNAFTPQELLLELTHISKIKFANLIRQNAKGILAQMR